MQVTCELLLAITIILNCDPPNQFEIWIWKFPVCSFISHTFSDLLCPLKYSDLPIFFMDYYTTWIHSGSSNFYTCFIQLQNCVGKLELYNNLTFLWKYCIVSEFYSLSLLIEIIDVERITTLLLWVVLFIVWLIKKLSASSISTSFHWTIWHCHI